jgi:hypothetical protein
VCNAVVVVVCFWARQAARELQRRAAEGGAVAFRAALRKVGGESASALWRPRVAARRNRRSTGGAGGNEEVDEEEDDDDDDDEEEEEEEWASGADRNGQPAQWVKHGCLLPWGKVGTRWDSPHAFLARSSAEDALLDAVLDRRLGSRLG